MLRSKSPMLSIGGTDEIHEILFNVSEVYSKSWIKNNPWKAIMIIKPDIIKKVIIISKYFGHRGRR